MATADDLARQPALEVAGLNVTVSTPAGQLRAVTDVNFSVMPGETFAIVGESGCGKSMTALAVMGLTPRAAKVHADVCRFDGRDLHKLDRKELSRLRGNRMAMIFQDPMTALNPVFTIGDQLAEGHQRHLGSTRAEALERAVFLLERVGIRNAATRLGQFPHQLSGGLRQRVMIAMAMMCEPKLIIADEPTTALDVTVQARILRLLRDLQQEFAMALVLITHDLGVVASVADRIAVMYAGGIVETGTALQVFREPRHPYTCGLIDCIPIPGHTEPGGRLKAIPGLVPSLIGSMEGCMFRNRCAFAMPVCAQGSVAQADAGDGHFYRCVREAAGSGSEVEGASP